MNRFQDPKYLLEQQYSTPANLEARFRLHDLYSTNPEDMQTWLLRRAAERLPASIDLLEVGGGHGKLWEGHADGVPAGWRITLTDFSPGMVAAARETLAPKYGDRIRFEEADAQALPFPDRSFDAVFAHFMLYHVPDREKAYAEIQRVLRPGGWFFSATLGNNHLKEIYDLARAFEDNFWELSFRLENGADELVAFFEGVELVMYSGGLAITAAEPLVDYVLSMVRVGPEHIEKIAALRAEIEGRLGRDGVIRVAKETGFFVCRKPASA